MAEGPWESRNGLIDDESFNNEGNARPDENGWTHFEFLRTDARS